MRREYISRELARKIAFNCVRDNTSLEALHGAYGISDAEMKRFNQEVTDNIFAFFQHPEMTADLRYPSYWDKPTVSQTSKGRLAWYIWHKVSGTPLPDPTPQTDIESKG